MAQYRQPTDEQVKEVVRKIPTLQLRRAFFEGLENPLWVAPLAKEGAFRDPPEPEEMGDGLIRDVYWPEMDYLVRVAPVVPAAVVDVLLKLNKSSNAWVRRGTFTIGAAIPPAEAARLQPLLRAWAPSGFGWRTDPREQVELVANLLEGGEREAGKWLASLLFKPSRAKGRRGHDAVLEDYWLEDGLLRVVAFLEEDGLDLVLPWLLAYERREGHLRRRSDVTYMSRDSVRHRSESHDHVEQTLIDATRDLAIKAALVNPEHATAFLLSTKMILARKIALFALAEALQQCVEDRDGDRERRQAIGRVATRLLLDTESVDDVCRIEYAELARSLAPVSPETLEALTGILEAGPQVDDDRLRRWLGRADADSAVVDERVVQYHESWLHRWLSAIGIDALPEGLRHRLADLDARLGVIESPLVPRERSTSWTGPNSPITRDEMSVMSARELVAHLESWHDSGDGWGPEPSHEGQGRTLTELLTTNPEAIAGVDNLVERLRPTYLRAILRGWEAALKSGLRPDWEQAAQVVREVLTHNDTSTIPTEGEHIDDDADFRWAKQAAVSLLEELVKKRPELGLPDKVMPAFADMLVSLADDETAWTEYIAEDRDSGADPLTVSLNWNWPMRLRGLVYLMSHGRDADWYERARAALERELVRRDPRVHLAPSWVKDWDVS